MDNNPELQFIEFCKNGNLSEAQKTYLNNPNIDISANNEKAFRWTCFKGHLEVCQWLLSVKPNIDISANNEDAFRWACFRGQLEVAQWLQSVKPYLYVIRYDKNGRYKSYSIRSKEEARWQQRKYLVWLASNQSPNKESILYKIPQDVSRYIIGLV